MTTKMCKSRFAPLSDVAGVLDVALATNGPG